MQNDKKNESPYICMANDKTTRKFRTIPEEDILDIEKYGIIPIGTDEIFVLIKGSNTHYISNYGRCIAFTEGVHLLNGSINERGKKVYSYIVWKNNRREHVNTQADALVVSTFIDENVKSYSRVWHCGMNIEDNYYRNLYPVTTKQYNTLKQFVKDGGFDTEEKIFEIINEEAYNSPSVLGVGYWGMPQVDFKHWTYIKWFNMLTRCYSDVCHKKQPTYIKCTVCSEWHSYANFKKWCEDNYYSVDNEVIELDKDILHKGNTIYSPETCIFVPKSINSMFVNNKASRGEYPIGVIKTSKEQFRVCLQKKTIGYYDNILEAFEVYKENKERLIKEVADKYRDKIPEKLYNALINWEVEYTD